MGGEGGGGGGNLASSQPSHAKFHQSKQLAGKTWPNKLVTESSSVILHFNLVYDLSLINEVGGGNFIMKIYNCFF